MNKLFIGFTIASMAVTVFGQGSITPENAPSEIMKTLEQIEPRIDIATITGNGIVQHIITNSGSYYLTSDIITPKFTAIDIRVANVTLDLNGFTISPGYIIRTAGISVATKMNSVTIQNGNILGFDYGVRFYSSPEYGTGAYLKSLNIANCKDYGILAGKSSMIVDCRVSNSGVGISSEEFSIISECVSHDNTGYGIKASVGTRISKCSSFNNIGTGIYALDGGNISDCVSYNNDNYGIRSGSGSLISSCSVSTNRGIYSLYVNSGSIITECNVFNNQCAYGIYASYNSIIEKSKSCGNTSMYSTSAGIYASAASAIISCTSIDNDSEKTPVSTSQGCGIKTISSAVKNCSVYGNKGDGILISSDCYVSENKCSNNGTSGSGAGIHVTSADNQISNNDIMGNTGYGIKVDVAGSFIVNNICKESGINYSIAAGNDTGTIKSILAGATSWDNFGFNY